MAFLPSNQGKVILAKDLSVSCFYSSISSWRIDFVSVSSRGGDAEGGTLSFENAYGERETFLGTQSGDRAQATIKGSGIDQA